MASNNLRIVSSNKVTSVGGTWTGTANNVLNDFRSSYATTNAATVTASIGTGFVVGTKVAVIVVLTNAVTAISMTVTATNYAPAASSASVVTTASTVGQGGGQYLAVYGTVTSGTSGTTFTITIPSGTAISRIIIGEYWSPTYNTSYGIQVGYEDTTSSERTQAGDQYSISGIRYKILSLDLEYLSEVDKLKFYDIIKYNGKTIPIFISVFPSNADDVEKEQMYSIYGKFTDLTTITHTMWTMYSSSVSLEEV